MTLSKYPDRQLSELLKVEDFALMKEQKDKCQKQKELTND